MSDLSIGSLSPMQSATDLGPALEAHVDLNQFMDASPRPTYTPVGITAARAKALEVHYAAPDRKGGTPRNVKEVTASAVSNDLSAVVKFTEKSGDDKTSFTSSEFYKPMFTANGFTAGPLVSARSKNDAWGNGARIEIKNPVGDGVTASYQHVSPANVTAAAPAFDEFKLVIRAATDPKVNPQIKVGATILVVDAPGTKKDSVEISPEASINIDGTTVTLAGTLVQRPGPGNDSVGVRVSVQGDGIGGFIRLDENFKAAGPKETVIQGGFSWDL